MQKKKLKAKRLDYSLQKQNTYCQCQIFLLQFRSGQSLVRLILVELAQQLSNQNKKYSLSTSCHRYIPTHRCQSPSNNRVYNCCRRIYSEKTSCSIIQRTEKINKYIYNTFSKLRSFLENLRHYSLGNKNKALLIRQKLRQVFFGKYTALSHYTSDIYVHFFLLSVNQTIYVKYHSSSQALYVVKTVEYV